MVERARSAIVGPRSWRRVVGGPAPLFESDWRTALGTSVNAVGDGAKWTTVTQGPANELEVIPATGLDFPAGMANVMRLTQRGETASFEVQKNGLALPASGDRRFYRLYGRWDEGNQAGYDHPIEPQPGACAITWAIKRNPRAGGVHHYHQFGDTAADLYYGLIDSAGADILLSKTATYRFEWMKDFITATGFKVDIRIYDSANTLLYTDANFYHLDFPGNASWRLDTRDPTFTSTHSCFQNFMIGNNGQAGWTNTGTFSYVGGVMIRSNNWCGAYVAP